LLFRNQKFWFGGKFLNIYAFAVSLGYFSPILTKPSLDKNNAQFWFGEKAKVSFQAKFHFLIKVLLLKLNFTVLAMFCFLLVNSLFQWDATDLS